MLNVNLERIIMKKCGDTRKILWQTWHMKNQFDLRSSVIYNDALFPYNFYAWMGPLENVAQIYW